MVNTSSVIGPPGYSGEIVPMGVVRGLKHEQSSSVALQTSNLTTSLNVWLICAISQWLSTKKMQPVLLGNTAIKVAQFSLLINL